MKNLLFNLFLLLVLAGCGAEPAGVAATKAPDNAVKVTYKTCSVYAASTEFIFTDETGEDFLVQVANNPAERTTKIPDNLVNPNPVEPPPGPNPAAIGKPFWMVKDTKGTVVEIRPVE